ncbi:hypothetical protein [Paraburkholderia dinghuensis]|uniref:DUF2846 domain-containing protein n=1 Tax=Paraburkholderia dinghuensis TaxID=2305225 RepID=A0A3N6PZN6_9BURK|nr:hypothetical protein [Paraburkholderia dinghuensis]RQH08000.1 hypothetical protein D1Y85_07825 [Paraburkholderia dinghuensis]
MASRVFRALLEPAANVHRGYRAASRVLALAMLGVLTVAGCGETPATPVPFKPVPAERVLLPVYVQPGEGLVAVDVRRERTGNVIVKFRDAPLYVDGKQVTDLMNGEHVVLYLVPGVHRIGVTTQFDPLVEIRFVVDPRYTNRASVTFDTDHRVLIRRVGQ